MVMLDSVKEQMREAWEDYAMVERISWVVSWPGQVVQGISCMAWTYEVSHRVLGSKTAVTTRTLSVGQQLSISWLSGKSPLCC